MNTYSVVSYTKRKKNEIKYKRVHALHIFAVSLEEMTGIKEYLMKQLLQVVNIVDCSEVYCVYQKCSILLVNVVI